MKWSPRSHNLGHPSRTLARIRLPLRAINITISTNFVPAKMRLGTVRPLCRRVASSAPTRRAPVETRTLVASLRQNRIATRQFHASLSRFDQKQPDSAEQHGTEAANFPSPSSVGSVPESQLEVDLIEPTQKEFAVIAGVLKKLKKPSGTIFALGDVQVRISWFNNAEITILILLQLSKINLRPITSLPRCEIFVSSKKFYIAFEPSKENHFYGNC